MTYISESGIGSGIRGTVKEKEGPEGGCCSMGRGEGCVFVSSMSPRDVTLKKVGRYGKKNSVSSHYTSVLLVY